MNLTQEVFVGDFAIRQKGATAITDRSRDKGNNVNRILLTAAMSFFANPFEEIHLVTNCPSATGPSKEAPYPRRSKDNTGCNIFAGCSLGRRLPPSSSP